MMGSTSGVSQAQANVLLQIATDPKGTKKRHDELLKEQAKANQAKADLIKERSGAEEAFKKAQRGEARIAKAQARVEADKANVETLRADLTQREKEAKELESRLANEVSGLAKRQADFDASFARRTKELEDKEARAARLMDDATERAAQVSEVAESIAVLAGKLRP